MKNKTLDTLLSKVKTNKTVRATAAVLSIFLPCCGGDYQSSEDTENLPLETLQECIYVSELHYDAEGRDNQNMNDEYAVFGNCCDDSIPMTDWTVQDASGRTYNFPQFALPGKGEAYLHSGIGEDCDNHLYWNSRIYPIWNNDTDSLTLKDSQGRTVLEESYDNR